MIRRARFHFVLGTKHKDLVTAMETDDLQERLLRFDEVIESRCPLFKFARDYMKFVMCILMFIRASREGDWNLHLESPPQKPPFSNREPVHKAIDRRV